MIHAGDRQSVLNGTRLDEVASLDLNGMHFLPAGLARAGQKDELRLAAKAATSDDPLRRRAKGEGQGRAKRRPRPGGADDGGSAQAEGKADQQERAGAGRAPPFAWPTRTIFRRTDACLSSCRRRFRRAFARGFKVEVGAEDGSSQVMLSAADGSLTLQDPHTILAVLDPLKSFGPSAFGPLRFRPVDANGAAGDWQPLIKLVRIPTPQRGALPRQPGQAMHTVRHQPVPDRFGRLRRAVYAVRPRALGLCQFHPERAAPEWHAAVSEAARRSGGDQRGGAAGAAGRVWSGFRACEKSEA